MAERDRVDVQVSVVYGHRTRKGLVQVKLGKAEQLMSPSKAREIATFLLEAAGAAEGDEALMAVLARTGADEGHAAQFLMALRQERARIDQQAREEARRSIGTDQFDLDKMN